jgi:hypothetical protein
VGVLRSREVVVGLLSAALGVGSVVLLGALGWPGEPFDCSADPCYCELPGAGLVRQPGNTWSNLAAVAVGLLVAGHAARRRLARPVPHPALDLFGLLAVPSLVFQGVGSMYFHGGLTRWGSALDAMSMFAIAGLLVVLQLHRLGWLTREALVPAWGSVVGAGLVIGFVSPAIVAGAVFVLFLSILAAEVRLSTRGRTPRAGLFRLGIAVHVTAVGVWFFSAAEGLPLCAPASPWQGHALWHVLTALSVGASVLHVMRNLELVGATEGGPAAVLAGLTPERTGDGA